MALRATVDPAGPSSRSAATKGNDRVRAHAGDHAQRVSTSRPEARETLWTEAAAKAAAIAETCEAVLADSVLSIILYGSLTTDDFIAGRSDIDLLILIDRPLSDEEIGELVTVVGQADPRPAAGIDLHVVLASVAAASPQLPSLELHVGRYPGEELEDEKPVDAAPDLAAELSIARATGRALHGPAPAEIIGPVDPDAIRPRSAHWLRTWLTPTDDSPHAAFMVLTACRMWRVTAEGRHSSKSAAAEWALARDGSLTAVRQALHQREEAPDTPVNPNDIRAVLLTVLNEIEIPDRKPE